MAKKSFIAGEDLTGKYGFAIVASADGAKVAGTAGVDCLGILMNDGKEGKAVGVAMVGEITKAKLGGAVDFGALLAVDANGKFVEQAESALAVAKALEDGAENDLIYVVVL